MLSCTKHGRGLGAVALVACVTAVFLASEVLAQNRHRVQFSPVGRVRRIGDNYNSRTFQAFSFGLDSLRTASRGPGTDLLRSSIGDPADLQLRRSGIGRSPSLGRAGFSTRRPGSRRLFQPAGSALDGAGGALSGLPSAKRGAPGIAIPRGMANQRTALLAATTYMAAINAAAGVKLTAGQGDKPISSLVPEEPSLYQGYMAMGDSAFRDGDFEKAFNKFKLANHIDRHDPESLLSMAHSCFGAGRFPSAGLYLRQALKYLPELALVPLNIRGFFGSEEHFDEKFAHLITTVGKGTGSADIFLVVAYFRWFDGQPQAAKDALNTARNMASRKDVKEAIDIFARGVAAGEAAAPTTRPAAAGRQASQPARATRAAPPAPSGTQSPTDAPAPANTPKPK